MKPTGLFLIIILFLVSMLSVPTIANTLPSAQSSGAKSAIVQNPGIIKYTPHMTVDSMASRAGTDIVVFPNGKSVKVGTIRNFQAAANIMRSPRVDRTPVELKTLPDKKIFKPVKTAYDLSAALKLPNSTTIRLPSGNFATVGQIKFAQTMIDKKTGNKLSALSQRPSLQGSAIKIPSGMTKSMTKDQQQAFWENILQQKDNTILESPNGIRITVGDLRKGLAKNIKTMPQQIPERRPQ